MLGTSCGFNCVPLPLKFNKGGYYTKKCVQEGGGLQTPENQIGRICQLVLCRHE